MKKHLTWFPFLIIALTVMLAVTIVVYDRQRNQLPPVISINDILEIDESSTVDSGLYYKSVRDVLAPVWSIVDGQSNEIGVIVSARNALLDMKVPSDERSLHIRIVSALNTLEAGVRGDVDSFADAQIRFSDLKNKAVWIQ